MPRPEEIAAALARNVRDLRRARQLSLAALAGLAGGSRGILLQIEGQRVNPSLVTLVRIGNALDGSVSALVDLGAGASIRVVRAADAVELWHGEHGARRSNPGGLLLNQPERPRGRSRSRVVPKEERDRAGAETLPGGGSLPLAGESDARAEPAVRDDRAV